MRATIEISAACILCGSRESRERWRTSDTTVRECTGCGLVFTPPAPAAAIESIYDAGYFESWGISHGSLAEAVRAMKRHTFVRYFDRLRRVLPEIAVPGAKTLDVGCATGYLPATAQELGYDAYGVELSAYAAALAEQLLPGRIFNGPLERAGYASGLFDIVTMCDLIEHVPDPAGTLAEAARVLRPGGALLLVTPDVESASARVLRKYWVNVRAEHLWYFNRDRLGILLDRQGFQTVYTGPASKATTIDYARRQFEAYPRPVLTRAAKLSRVLPRMIREHPFFTRVGDMLVVARRAAG